MLSSLRRFAPVIALLPILLVAVVLWRMPREPFNPTPLAHKTAPSAQSWLNGPPNIKGRIETMPTFTAGTDDNELYATGTTASTSLNYQIVKTSGGAATVFDSNTYGVNGEGWGMEQLISSEDPTYITVPADAANGTYAARWYDDDNTTWRSAPFDVSDGVADTTVSNSAGFMSRYRAQGH